MISFSRFRHQLIYTSFNLVTVVDDNHEQLFNVAVLDDNRVITIERRWSKCSSSQDYHCRRCWCKHFAFDFYFIELEKQCYVNAKWDFSKHFILSLIYLFHETTKFWSLIIYFSFSILLKSLRITRSEFCDVSTSISNTVQTYCDDSTKIMLDQFESFSQYQLMNVT
jgi:hypothetical protein